MTFQEAVQDAFSKYVQFSGRSSRAAYWYWALFAVLVYIVTAIIDSILGTVALFYGIAAIALFLPSLGVLWRRLHDTGHSGWWVLIQILPLIGFIVMLVFLLTPSEGPNQYGDGPDGGPAVAAAAPAAPAAQAPPAPPAPPAAPAPPAPPAPPTDGPQA